jgi:hypothetical protein
MIFDRFLHRRSTRDVVQDKLAILQDKLDETIDDMAESRLASRRNQHNWWADVATGLAALLLAGLFTGLAAHTSEVQHSREGRPDGGMGRVDAVGPTGVYPVSGVGADTPSDAEPQGMADWGRRTKSAL